MYETLWIDKEGAQGHIDDLSADPAKSELAAQLEFLAKFGYSIIRDAVPGELIDAYLQQCKDAVEAEKLSVSYGLDIVGAKGVDLLKPLTKILDTHVPCEAARRIMFAPKIKAFLEGLFLEAPLAFQSLHFEVGSTQSVHNDTAYVVLDEPKSMCAIWVALEDIAPGSGELIYYPGSHRFNDFLYGDNRKNWSQPEDGNDLHHHHLFWIHDEAKRLGIELQSFRPKKGDVLFWHADLCHGGGPITQEGTTRRSLVVHYCPVHCTPHYFQYIEADRQKKMKTPEGGYVSSFYYPIGQAG